MVYLQVQRVRGSLAAPPRMASFDFDLTDRVNCNSSTGGITVVV